MKRENEKPTTLVMEMLMHRGLSDNELKKLKINKEKYTELMKNDLEAIDVYLANQLEKIFGIQKDFWLNMQKNYEKEEKAKKWMEMKEYEQTTKIMCPKCNIYQTKHIEEERPKEWQGVFEKRCDQCGTMIEVEFKYIPYIKTREKEKKKTD